KGSRTLWFCRCGKILHGLAGIYALWTRRKKAGWTEGILALAFVGVVFSVGWTIMTMLASLVLPPEGFGEWFKRDTITLILLTFAEGIFYYFLLRSEKPRQDQPEGKPPVSAE
ncbi:MAG: hypothetical protein WEF53_09085, partial [Bacteroidota bacterium]